MISCFLNDSIYRNRFSIKPSIINKTYISNLVRTTHFCVSGMTFIRYAQKAKSFGSFGSNTPKGLNRIDKIVRGHLCLREENLNRIDKIG